MSATNDPGSQLWESLTATLAQIADRNLPGWDAGEMAMAAKTVVERSDWLQSILAAERERIAQAIEAERDDKPAGLGNGPIVQAYQGGLHEAARIARNSP